MPSDARTPQALDALTDQIQAFRSALANTSEQIRLLISTRAAHNGSSTNDSSAELGEFAAGRIDSQRLSHLLVPEKSLGAAEIDVITRALHTCDELLARKENLFRVIVEEGEDLRECVGRALADVGRAYGAARVVELVTKEEYDPSEHDALLEHHPFERWSRSERAVELCLVVRVSGRDLRPAGLADYLDRSLKLVLVVQGDAPPASLVRLITPGTLVLQTSEAAELEWLAGFDGPGVAALVSDKAAQFRHDPAGGPGLVDRVVITRLPDRPVDVPARLSAFQQEQDLMQLEALAVAPAHWAETEPKAASAADRTTTSAPVPAESSAEPADKLSAWLLDRAGFTRPS